jgi:hypothetical protein
MSVENGLRTDVQFSVFLVNKPGVLSRVVHSLAEGKINILAMSIMESTEHGVLRLVAGNTERAREVLKTLDVPNAETTVLCATLPNRPGALADVVERLASNHINVHYAYVTTGAAGGKTLGIFKVSDHTKAMSILAKREAKRKTDTSSTRWRHRRG